MGLRQIGRKRNGALEAGQRLVSLSQRIQCPPQQHMGPCVARFAYQRFARALSAFCKAAVLTGHHAQVIVRLGVAGLDAQYLCVTRSRLGHGAPPVQCQSLLQQVTGC